MREGYDQPVLFERIFYMVQCSEHLTQLHFFSKQYYIGWDIALLK
jgi:hypothetical protein